MTNTELTALQESQQNYRTQLNQDLYKEAINVFDKTYEEKQGAWSYGKIDIGAFIDHLEANYTITPINPMVAPYGNPKSQL